MCRGQGRAAAPRGPSLFAFPLESNYSGARYAPAMVNQIQTEGLVVSSQKQAKEPDFAQSQAQETRASGQLQSGVQPASCSNLHQPDHQQQRGEVEVQQAAQRGTKAEEGHGQHQPAAEEEAPDSLSGQQGGEEEEEAGGLSGRSSYSEGARWHVLIDAAKACATAPPDLTKHPADFVVNLWLPSSFSAFSRTADGTCLKLFGYWQECQTILLNTMTGNSSCSGSLLNIDES